MRTGCPARAVELATCLAPTAGRTSPAAAKAIRYVAGDLRRHRGRHVLTARCSLANANAACQLCRCRTPTGRFLRSSSAPCLGLRRLSLAARSVVCRLDGPGADGANRTTFPLSYESLCLHRLLACLAGWIVDHAHLRVCLCRLGCGDGIAAAGAGHRPRLRTGRRDGIELAALAG